MSLWFALLLAAGVDVVADSPDVDCPSRAQVADAVDRRLAPSTGEGGPWTLHFGVEGTPVTRVVRFTLVGPNGATSLERRVPSVEHECLAAAATIAAIVDRHLSELGWTMGAPLPPVMAPPREPARGPPPPVVPREGVLLTIGPAVRADGGASGAGLVGARLPVWRLVHVGLAVLVPARARGESLSTSGRVDSDEWQARVSVWAVRDAGRLQWTVGPELLAGLQSARSTGISQQASAHRVLMALGVGGGPSVRLGGKWRVAVELGAYRSLPATTFYVTEAGGNHEVLAPSAWRLLAALTLGYAIE